MGRESYKAIERAKHIASLSPMAAKEYLANEKRAEPERSEGSLERVVRTTSPRCLKCEAEAAAINHNAGNIPGIGYEEETQYKCKTCGYDWWS